MESKDMRIKWEQNTRNSFSTRIGDGLSGLPISIHRPQTWKSQNLRRPWRITLFGNPFAVPDNGFETFEDARVVAERVAKERIGRVAEMLGYTPPKKARATATEVPSGRRPLTNEEYTGDDDCG